MKDGQIYRSGSFIIATYLMALAATAVAVPTSRKFLGVCLEKNSITFK
jgi:hypothetical protein